MDKRLKDMYKGHNSCKSPTHNSELYLLVFIVVILTTYMGVTLNSVFDREIKIYYVTQVLKQCIKTKTMCPN